MPVDQTPKSNTDCVRCDLLNYPHCRCGGGSDDKGADQSNSKAKADKTKIVFNSENQKPLADKEGKNYQALVPLEKIEGLFEDYLKQLAEEDLTTVDELKKLGYSAVREGNLLTITMPDAKRSDAFIKSLGGMIKPLTQAAENMSALSAPPAYAKSPFAKYMETPELSRK